MKELKTRADLEVFAQNLLSCFAEIPENLRLLIILEAPDFDNVINDILPPWQRLEHMDRFIFNSGAGVEFGIKRKQS